MSPGISLTLDAYIRVSQVRGREGESFISPDVQRDQIHAWAKQRGVTIAAEHVDLDQTGGKLQRPGLDALMERIRSGQTGGVVVARLDRLSRASVAEALKLVDEIDSYGGKVAAVDLGIDPTTPFGEFALTIMLALARMERRRITDNWDVAAAHAIARGIHITNAVPFGYQRSESGRLVIDPDAAPFVREMFRRRAERESWWEIADWLNEAASRGDGRTWTNRNVATMIQSRTYRGEAHHGEHRNPEAHEPIVTQAEWDAANAVKGGHGHARFGAALLAGIIRCAGCRYAMRYSHTTRKLVDGSPVEYAWYACQRKHTGGVCEEPAHVMAHTIEPVVIAQFLLWHGLRERVDEPPNHDALDAAERALENAEARLERFLDDDELRDVLERERFLDQARARQTAVDTAREERDKLRKESRLDQTRTFLVADEWESLTREEQAQRLRAAIDSVYIKRGHAQRQDAVPIPQRAFIRWAGEDHYELPRRGTTNYRSRPIPFPPSDLLPYYANIPEWAIRRGHPMLNETLRQTLQQSVRQAGESPLTEWLAGEPTHTSWDFAEPSADYRRALGLEDDDDYSAFEKARQDFRASWLEIAEAIGTEMDDTERK